MYPSVSILLQTKKKTLKKNPKKQCFCLPLKPLYILYDWLGTETRRVRRLVSWDRSQCAALTLDDITTY